MNIGFKKNFKFIILILVIHIIVFFCIGGVFGFSDSPYNHELIAIFINIIIQVFPIIGIEIIRGCIVSKSKKRNWILIFSTIVLMLLEVRYNILFSLLGDKEKLFHFVCSSIIPLISYSFLYTYLCVKCSCITTLSFRITYKLSILLLPVIPNADWFVIGTTSVLLASIIYMMFKERKKQNYIEKVSFFITIILSIILVLFMLGAFKYEPIAILSNSMRPAFSKADVVIFKKVSNTELREIPINSIIVYSIGDQNIVHRVVDRIEEDGQIIYRTKGDSNNAPDLDAVEITQIQGIYKLHIKYIGYPSVWLYEYFHKS